MLIVLCMNIEKECEYVTQKWTFIFSLLSVYGSFSLSEYIFHPDIYIINPFLGKLKVLALPRGESYRDQGRNSLPIWNEGQGFLR